MSVPAENYGLRSSDHWLGFEPQQLTTSCCLSPGAGKEPIKTAGHLLPVDEEAVVPKSPASLLPPQ